MVTEEGGRPRRGRVGRGLARAAAAILVGGLALGAARAEPEGDAAAEVLALVDGEPITEASVSRFLAVRPPAFGADPEAARERALELLVAERELARWVRDNVPNLSGPVGEALADARRRILFDVWAGSTFEPAEPEAAAVAAFVEENPHLFEERVVYRFQRIVAVAQDAALRARAEGIVAGFAPGRRWSEADVQRLVEALAAIDATARVSNVWTGSEALGAETRERLEALAGSGLGRDLRSGEAIDVVVLHDRRAAPVDPALLGDEIAARLGEVAWQRHRWETARTLSASALGREDAEGDPFAAAGKDVAGLADPGAGRERWAVALGGVAATVGAALVLCVSWIRRARRRVRRVIEAGYFGAMPFREKTAFAATCSAVALFALALAAFGVGSRAIVPLGGQAAAVIALGAALLGAGFGELVRRRIR